MRKKLMAVLLCALMTFQLAAFPAKAQEYICFVAAGESILPLSSKEMPFWNGGYLYISSSIFTGIARDTLSIGRVRNDERKLVILHSGGRSLSFEWEKTYAQDQDGNTYYPGALYRSGEVYVPATVVARFFNLQCTVTRLNASMDGEAVQGELAWLRPPGHILTDRLFANAANSQILSRYREYLREKEKEEELAVEIPEASEDGAIDGKRIYLCLTAGEDTPLVLDALDRYGAQAAFFCTPEFLETEGNLLRRMIATGQSIGILVDAADGTRTITEQLADGNRALERATCGKTRLAMIQNGNDEEDQTAAVQGYRCLEPDMDRTGYQLRGASNAESLLQRVSARWGDVTIWLGDTATAAGLRAFLSETESAEGRCLAWTETA